MHQGNTERELMDWYDRQETDTKWRITAFVVTSGRPMREILQQLKRVSDSGKRIHLVHPGSKQKH